MDKNIEHSFSNIVSINPYKNSYINGISDFLSEIDSPEYKKEQFIISCLNSQGFINSQIAITKNIPQEDIFDAISNKAYEDLALDQAIEYQVQYIEDFNNIDSENRYFNVFIVDPQTVTETYEHIVSDLKYIDVITPTPLLLKSLYSKEIIEDSGLHCFVYFQENDTFITLYNEKEFLYTKSLKYSFVEMHERFCELYGERVEYEEFISFLSTQNLKDTTSDYKKYILKLYREVFANVNDILTYVKRAFEINKIDHLYIGSQISTQIKLNEIIEVELGIKSSNFEFDYGYEQSDVYIDQIHSLMHLYTTLPQSQKYDCNFTTFLRPPKFIQRQSGKLIALSVASLIAAFAYPGTYWSMTYGKTIHHELLQQEYKELHNVRVTREATIKSKLLDKEKALKLLNQEIAEYEEKKATLIKIHDVKVNYPMKAKLSSMLMKDLNKFNVKLESLSYAEDEKIKEFKLNLLSIRDKQTTELVEYLTKTYEGKFKFSLEEILFEEDSQKYVSELKVIVL